MVYKPLTPKDRSLRLILTNESTVETLIMCSSLTYSSTHGYKIPTHYTFFMHTQKHTHTARQLQ